MNADFVRAWRYLHKYMLGLVALIEIFVVVQGNESATLLLQAGHTLLKNDINTVFALLFILFLAIVGSTLLDLLLTLFSSISLTLIRLSSGSRFVNRVLPLDSRATWLSLLLYPISHLLQATTLENKAMLVEYLHLISVGNLAKDRGPEITKHEAEFFERVVTFLSRQDDSDLLWHLIYAHQFTQDRREIDALQTDVSLAFGYGLAGAMGIPVVVVLSDRLLPFAQLTLPLLAAVTVCAAVRHAVLARRKQVSYMTSLCMQLFAWGEQGEVQDRDAF